MNPVLEIGDQVRMAPLASTSRRPFTRICAVFWVLAQGPLSTVLVKPNSLSSLGAVISTGTNGPGCEGLIVPVPIGSMLGCNSSSGVALVSTTLKSIGGSNAVPQPERVNIDTNTAPVRGLQ